MVLKYQISPYPALTQNMVLKIWEAGSDGSGAEIYTETIPEKNGSGVPTPGAGHQVINTIEVNGLDKVVHIVRLYSAVSAALLHEYNVEPKEDLVTVFDPIQFKIGDGGANTPLESDDTYQNDLLIGLSDDDYLVHRNNYGFLIPGTHYTTDSGGGAWQLTSPDVFNPEEEFTIVRKPAVITTVVNDSVVGKWFAGFVNISANTNYSSTHLRKLIRFSGTCAYTFQVSDTIPIGYAFVFQHFGTAGTGTVNFSNGTLLWAGSPKTSIAIPSYCEACFVWDGTNWNVVYISQSTFINTAAAPQAGDIIAVGSVSLGDVPAGDPIYTITHNQNVSGDYKVFPSIQSNNAATYFRDNKLGCCWYHHATDKPNKFYVSLQEISPEVQDITLCWLMVKV